MTDVLISSFSIIGLGYFLRATKVVDVEAGKGIGVLIGKVSAQFHVQQFFH